MTQQELNREVARITGESVRAVSQFGFSLADPLEIDFDPEPGVPRYVDWDELEIERPLAFPY